MDCLLESHITFDADDRSKNWQQRQERHDKQKHECRFQQSESWACFQPLLADYASGSEQHGISWR